MRRTTPAVAARGLLLTFLVIFTATALAGCAFRSGSAKKPAYPSYQNYVNDTADMISPSMESQLNALAADLDKRTSAQVAILTVPTTEPETLEQYAVAVFQKWGIGQKDKDNGVLLLVAPDNPSNSRIRIEVGYGLEGALTDIQSKHIITDLMTPACRSGNMDSCVASGFLGIVNQVASEYDLALTSSGTLVPKDEAGGAAFDNTTVTTATGTQSEYHSTGQTSSPSTRKPASPIQLIFYGILGIAALILLITNPQLFFLLLLSGGRGGGWSGGDRGGFGGGFGGFGGGSSGGGGASGGW